MAKKEVIEAPTVLYGPRDGRSIKKTYPELENNPLFKKMLNDDILFAWYIGIPNSPVDKDLPEPTRYKSAAFKCFPNNEEKKRKYADFDVSIEVKLAIEEFKKFSPEARAIAKNMVQTIFNKYQKMIDVDVEKDFLITRKVGKGESQEEITEIDWTGRKQFIDSAATIRKELPGLLKDLEEGFGVTEVKKKEEGNGNKSIDIFHKRRQENQS